MINFRCLFWDIPVRFVVAVLGTLLKLHMISRSKVYAYNLLIVLCNISFVLEVSNVVASNLEESTQFITSTWCE